MTYADAIRFLYSLRWFGAKFGLANSFKLAALAGNPQNRLRFIHVAGTNGKGSTCAMLESIYRAAGLRVGLFTSPHLVAFGERIQVNRHAISARDIGRLVAEMQALLEEGWGKSASHAVAARSATEAASARPGRCARLAEHPTFFEVVTIMALRYFAEQKCDLVIWETGLGGRLDATNIVTPLVSVITNIQYDHQKWLGETLASIAAEKAGIIKPGIPVITAAEGDDALRVIAETARRQNAPLTILSPAEMHRPPLDSHPIAAARPASEDERRGSGRHRAHAGLADPGERRHHPRRPVPRPLGRTAAIGHAAIRAEDSARWRAQCWRRRNPGGCGEGILSLSEAHAWCSASCATKTGRACAKSSRRWPSASCWCRFPASAAPRRRNSPKPAGAPTPRAQVTEHASLREALAATAKDAFLTIAGSLYLVGEAMELLHLSPAKAADERGLNEWSGVATHAEAAAS